MATTIDTFPELTNVECAAKLLDVSAFTIRDWCRRGLIDHVRLPSGQIRFEVAKLRALLDDGTIVREPPKPQWDEGLEEARQALRDAAQQPQAVVIPLPDAQPPATQQNASPCD